MNSSGLPLRAWGAALRRSSGQALRLSSGQALRLSSGQALRRGSGQAGRACHDAKEHPKRFNGVSGFAAKGYAA